MPITVAVNDYNINNATSAFGFQTLFVDRSTQCDSMGFEIARRLSATWGPLKQASLLWMAASTDSGLLTNEITHAIRPNPQLLASDSSR